MRTVQLVIFRYKQELDQDGIPRKGELYTVRYEAVNAVLLPARACGRAE